MGPPGAGVNSVLGSNHIQYGDNISPGNKGPDVFTSSPSSVVDFTMFRNPGDSVSLDPPPLPAGAVEAGTGDGSDLIDITPYLSILENGIQTMHDRMLANELIELIDPDEGKSLVLSTFAVPLRTVDWLDLRAAGSTDFKEYLTSRQERALAYRINLAKYYVPKQTGAGLLTYIHEMVHAAPFGEWPQTYRDAFPESGQVASFYESFRRTLRETYWDESIAHSAPCRFAEKFRARTGRDIREFRSERLSGQDDDAQAAYREGGFQGVFDWVSNVERYLPYRVAIFQQAVLSRLGVRKIPSVKEILAMMLNSEGKLTMRGTSIFFTMEVIPKLKELGISLNGLTGNISPAHLSAVKSYLQARYGGEDEIEHSLRHDFDMVVQAVGIALGDPPPKEQRPVAVQLKEPRALRRRFLVRGGWNYTEAKEKPGNAADIVEINGTYVGQLCEVLNSSVEEIQRHWQHLIEYAEVADPRSAAHVYNTLMGSVPPLEQTEYAVEKRWQLGLSLIRSGYDREGRRLLAEVLKQDNRFVWGRRFSGKRVSKGRRFFHDSRFHELGAHDTLQQFIRLAVRMIPEAQDGGALSYEKALELANRADTLFHLVVSEYDQDLPPALLEDMGLGIDRLMNVWATLIRAYEKDERLERVIAYGMSEMLKHKHLMPKAMSLLTRIHNKFRKLMILSRAIATSDSRELSRAHLLNAYRHVLDEIGRGESKVVEIPNEYRYCPRVDIFWRSVALFDDSVAAYEPEEFGHLAMYHVHSYLIARELIESGRRASISEGWSIIRDGFPLARTESLIDLGEGRFFNSRYFRVRAAAKMMWHLGRDERREAESIIMHQLEAIAGQDTGEERAAASRRQLFFDLIKEFNDHGEMQLSKRVAAIYHDKCFDGSARPIDSIERKILDTHFVFKQHMGSQGDIERISRDLRDGRGYFDLDYILWRVEIFGRPRSNASGLAARGLRRYAHLAVDAFLQSGKGFGKLVDTFDALEVPAKIKDEFFSYLIERLTPEEGMVLVAADGVRRHLFDLPVAAKLIYAIMDNDDLRNSQRLLIERSAKLLRYYTPGRGDSLSRAAVSAMRVFFRKFAQRNPAHLNPLANLVALRDTESYRRAYQGLFSMANARESEVDHGTLLKRYRNRRDGSPVFGLTGMDAKLIAAIDEEIGNFVDSRAVGNGNGFEFEDVVQGCPIIGELYHDMMHEFDRGRAASKLCVHIINILARASSTRVAEVKKGFYARHLDDVRIPLELRRSMFMALGKAGAVSNYASRLREKLERSGDHDGEERVLRIVKEFAGRTDASSSARIKRLVDHGSDDLDIVLSWTYNTDPSEADRIESSYRRYLRGGSRADELEHMWHLIFASSRDSLTFVDVLVGAIGHIVSKRDPDIMGMDDTYFLYKRVQEAAVRYFPRAVRFVDELRDHNSLRRVVRNTSHLFADMSAEEVEELLPYMPALDDLSRRQQDRIRTDAIDLPPALQQEEPLAHFLLTRYFMEMESQQDVLYRLKGRNRVEGLRMVIELGGLEKLGQIISYWPGVPVELRQELRHLQSNVTRSQLDEVVGTIREEFSGMPKELVDELIANMDPRPLGVGSIGDCYRSRITTADGVKEVVIKVITEKKEDKFRRALKRMRKVRELLPLYDGEIPHVREAIGIIDMYLEMVEQEFDLMNEAHNIREASELEMEGVVIPKVVTANMNGNGAVELARPKVLVTEFFDGTKITDVKDDELRIAAAMRAKAFVVQQIMLGRPYHSDLQPGNIRVNEETGLVALLDFGQVGHMNEEQHSQVMRFMNTMTIGDRNERVVGISNSLMRLVREDVELNCATHRLHRNVGRVLDVWSMEDDPDAEMVADLFSAAEDADIKIASPYWQLLKGLASIQATMIEAQDPPDSEPPPAIPPPIPDIDANLSGIRILNGDSPIPE